MLSHPLALSVAPMEGISTFPMRLWLYIVSQPQLMTTPFLRVTRVQPERDIPKDFAPELYELRGILPYELTPQLITGDPEQFLRAADLIPPLLAPVLEINCGCPSPNSMGHLAGSGMLHDKDAFGRMIERLSDRLGPGRLAVKMRLGITDSQEFPGLFQAIADLPLARLTVHGRTRAYGYRGHARWEDIGAAAKSAQFPVIASGDILGSKTLEDLGHAAPDLRGAMIGRGVLRNPWVFEEIRTSKATEMDLTTLVHALFCYTLLQELWQNHPQKLLARVASGRIGSPCGTYFPAWEKLTVELTGLVFGVPFLVTRGFKLPSAAISAVAFGRLKILWAYLRSGLASPFSGPSLVRAKDVSGFFEQILASGGGEPHSKISIGHQAEWDTLFAGARG